MSGFTFHREPLAHQRTAFERFFDAPYFALFFEQRCGKSKVVLDLFRSRVERNQVDALIVIAYPNGVHRVLVDEAEKDLPPEFLAGARTFAWNSGRVATKATQQELLSLRDHPGPVILTLNCEAIITEKGWKYLEWFVRKRRVMLVADESSWAASWSARTKKLLALGRRPNVIVRAILDGTPADEGATDLYFPCKFLAPSALGFETKAAFVNRYCEFEEEEDPDHPGVFRRVKRDRRGPGGKIIGSFEIFKGYRNLTELRDKISEFGMRVTRADVSDAPEKVYQTRYFQLTPKQRRVYDELRGFYEAEVDGWNVRLPEVLKRLTRLQMVSRNFYPPEKEGRICAPCGGIGYADDGAQCTSCGGLGIVVELTALRRIDDRSPALEALAHESRATRGPVLVWCRFHQDVTDAVEALRAVGRVTFRYDGTVPADERERAYQAFRAGEGDAIVGTILSGLSRGKDLTRAVALIYYSNEFSLRARRQSEDRAEGLARTFGTGIVDLVAEDTRDVDAVKALREKRSIAAMITGDPDKAWI